VYVARDPAAISRYKANPAIVRRMVDRLVVAATAQPDVVAAWRSLVSPDDKAGIKICAAGGEIFTTHSDVVAAVADGLRAASVRLENILIWDRHLVGINDAGYRNLGYRLSAIEPRVGYDGTAVVNAPLLGKLIWGDLRFVPHLGANPIATERENTSDESHFAKILTQQVTKVINVPVMSDSSAAGLAGCIYNMTVPNVDNWRRFTQYDYASGVGIAQVYDDPTVARKVVLHIMDGLIATTPADRKRIRITPCTRRRCSRAKIRSRSMSSCSPGSRNFARRPSCRRSASAQRMCGRRPRWGWGRACATAS